MAAKDSLPQPEGGKRHIWSFWSDVAQACRMCRLHGFILNGSPWRASVLRGFGGVAPLAC
jgi:hypothetical protein